MDPSTALALLLGYVPTQYAVYVLAASGLCAVAAAVWPRPADGSAWLPLYQVVNALGCNFLAARNHSSSVAAAPAPVELAAAGGTGTFGKAGPLNGEGGPGSSSIPVATVGETSKS